MPSPSTQTIELLSIGREILDGRVIDTNSIRFAEALKTKGLVPRYAQKVDDDPSRIREAFAIAQKRNEVVLVTGGLGPTSDDLTTQCFADFIGKPLIFFPNALEAVEKFFSKVGRKMTDIQKKQAYFPEGSVLLTNENGSAPGFQYSHEGVNWFFLPGVPRELEPMLKDEVLPKIQGVEGYQSLGWATHFTSEGELQSRLASVISRCPAHFEISFRTRYPENHIGLHGAPTSGEKALFSSLADEIEKTLGEDAFSKRELRSLEEITLDLLRSKGLWISTVESCTGGLIGERLTSVAGSSASYFGGFITYDNRAKTDLGVPESLLISKGAVSEEVAIALAEAGLEKMKKSGITSGVSISTTGIAGPTGETPLKPVGLCFVGLASTFGVPQAWKIQAPRSFDRTLNRQYFSQFALDQVRRLAISLLQT